MTERCEYISPDGLRLVCALGAGHGGRHYAERDARFGHQPGHPNVCPRCGLLSDECLHVAACDARSLRYNLRARGLATTGYNEKGIWLRGLGVAIEIHPTRYPTPRPTRVARSSDYGNEVWVPLWVAHAMNYGVHAETQERVIRQLVSDPLAAALVTSHPDSLYKLLDEAEAQR